MDRANGKHNPQYLAYLFHANVLIQGSEMCTSAC